MMPESPAAPVREFVLRFAPEAQRAAIGALFDVERELAATARDGLDHAVAHARLDWWDEELERLAVAAPRHPTTRLLAAAAAAAGRTPPDLRPLVEAARIDVARVAFLERAELDTYLGHWAQGLFRALTLTALAGDDAHAAAAERYAGAAGPALREIELLALVTRHARAGRVYTPLGDPPRPHAPWTCEPLAEGEAASLRTSLADARDRLRAAVRGLPAAVRPSLSASLTWAALGLRNAQSCLAALPHIPQPARTEPLRRNLLAWRAALAAARGRLPAGFAA